jgi:hypothetical protein
MITYSCFFCENLLYRNSIIGGQPHGGPRWIATCFYSSHNLHGHNLWECDYPSFRQRIDRLQPWSMSWYLCIKGGQSVDCVHLGHRVDILVRNAWSEILKYRSFHAIWVFCAFLWRQCCLSQSNQFSETNFKLQSVFSHWVWSSGRGDQTVQWSISSPLVCEALVLIYSEFIRICRNVTE